MPELYQYLGGPATLGARLKRVLASGPVTEILDITTKHCTVERDGPVVILTMNRPEKKNALSGDMLAGLVLGYEYIDDH